MKHCLVILVGMIAGGTAMGAGFSTVDGPTYHGVSPVSRTPVSFTQNWDTETIEPVQVACGVSGTYTTQNWYLRRFYMSDYGIVYPLNIQSVNFGVQLLAMADLSAPPAYSADLKLYSINTPQAFLFANLEPLVSAIPVAIVQADEGTILTAVVPPCVLPINKDLVVAIDAPSGELIGAGLSFYPGANSLGADLDAFLAAADCGVTEPVGVSDIGFPDSQTIFVVNSDTCCPPIPTEITHWGRIKALYR